MGTIYDVLSIHSSLAFAAGCVFENRMHQLFVSGWDLGLFPIPRRSGTTNYLYDDYTATRHGVSGQSFQLAQSEEYQFDAAEIKKIVIEENRYYRPETKNFTTVDSFFLHHPPEARPILFMFQITRAQDEHDAKPEGLILMDDLNLTPALSNVRKIYVVVTPERTYPTITVPKEYHDSHGPLEVFHHPAATTEIFP